MPRRICQCFVKKSPQVKRFVFTRVDTLAFEGSAEPRKCRDLAQSVMVNDVIRALVEFVERQQGPAGAAAE